MKDDFTINDNFSYLKVIPRKGKLEELSSFFTNNSKTIESADWSDLAVLKDVLPYLRCASIRKKDFLIGFDLFKLSPLDNYPSQQQLVEKSQKNERINKEIKEQQSKDLDTLGIGDSDDSIGLDELNEELGDEFADVFGEFIDELYIEDNDSKGAFPTSLEACSKELKEQRLIASIEEIMTEILNLQGIDEAHLSFRNCQLDKRNEIYTTGSNEDGVYICSIDDKANISTW